jgi:hypothetical protein
MDGKINSVNSSYLLEEINEKLGLKLTGEESLALINDVLTPFLQKQFDEGVYYAKQKVSSTLDDLLKDKD